MTQPTDTNVDEEMSLQVQVATVDDDGNIDIDISSTIEMTSSGSMTGDPISNPTTDGIADFPSITHTQIGSGLTLTANASSTTFSDVVSNAFNIINPNTDAVVLTPTSGGNSIQIPDSEIVAAEALTANDAKEVFLFRVQDLGEDNTSTKISQVTFTASATNTTDWTNYIEGVQLNDNDESIIYTPSNTTIDTDSITLTFDTPIFVDDASTKDLTAEIYLQSAATLVEDEVISFEIIANNHGFEADASGSGFESSFDEDITGNNHVIDIIATEFQINIQPTDTNIYLVMNPAVEVALVDINGNLDADNNSIITLSSTGTLLGTTVSKNAVDGLAEFPNLIHTASGTDFNLIATNGSFTPINSDLFDIIAPVILVKTIARQDFDETPPEWIITNVDPATNNTWGTQYFEEINSNIISPLSNANFSANIFGANNVDAANNTSDTIELSEIDISNFTDVTLSFDYAYMNLDGDDEFKLEIIYNDDTVLKDFLEISVGDQSDIYETNIDDSKTSIKLKITLYNNNADEYIGIDNIKLEGKETTIDYVYENDTWTPNDPQGNSSINDNILIKDNNTTWPDFTSTIFVNTIEIEPLAQLTLSNEVIIYGDFTVDGELINSSTSKIDFVGTKPQTFGGAAASIDLYRIESSATAGLELTSSFNLYESLTIGNGDISIASGEELTVKSSDTLTAVIGRIADGSQIEGDLMIERYIPKDNRAFRYLSSPITTSGSIRDNFQEGINNTGTDYPTDNEDPNPGYGTHITGSQSGSDGFDATETGNASMFEWQGGIWNPISNTDSGVLQAGKPYSLMIRGDRSTTLTSNDAVGPATTLRMTGEGKDLVYGTSNVPGSYLTSSQNAFVFVGNKYQSQVDMKQMVEESTDFQQSVYIYDPTINTIGAYVVVDLTTQGGTPTPPASQDKYLQPNQAFFIKTVDQTASVNPSMQFKEIYKSNESQSYTAFSQNESDQKEILLSLNKEIDENFKLADGLRIQFNENFTNQITDEDVYKFWNEGENISTHLDDVNYLTIDRREEANEETEVQLFLHNFETSNYELELKVTGLENAFLYDAYSDETHPLDLGMNTISFDVDTTSPSSIASDRFKFIFENETLANPSPETAVDLSIYPNPNKKESLTLRSTKLNGEKVKLNVYDNFGRLILSQKHSFENQVITLDFTQRLNAGIYHLELSNENTKINKKLIIE